ncbi:MAG: adenylosuccinate synthase [Bacteroidales bacterium]|nr:adenylosuccinate synthase [Bacteroidales bacterium]
MKIDVLLGLQWGDEGKGKIVDVLSPNYDIIARFQGGPNAGHTLEIKGDRHVLHTIPSGIFHPEKINVIGNGVIVDPRILLGEVEKLRAKGVEPTRNLKISKRSHLILPTHRMLDAAYESALGKDKIGSTLKGIGPCYTDKTARYGLRFGDILAPDFREKYNQLKDRHLRILNSYNFELASRMLDNLTFEQYESDWFKAINQLKDFDLIDSELYLNKALREGKRILAEGAQGSLLDVDFGSYPFVTSSNTITAGVCSGLGVPPSSIDKVFGVFKAYCTRVGSGPFPTELFDETGEFLRTKGHEFGSTTGRPRRCGWLDLPALRYAIMLNGVTDLVMMKADVLNDLEQINICTAYGIGEEVVTDLTYETLSHEVKPVFDSLEGWKPRLDNQASFNSLPLKLKDYIEYIEKSVELPISILSIGPGREQTIVR